MGNHEQQHRGRVVDWPADKLRVEFASVLDAGRCAVAMQQEFKARNAELPPMSEKEASAAVGDSYVAGDLGANGVGMPALLIDPRHESGLPANETINVGYLWIFLLRRL